jgi:hypothetical protein
MEARGLNHGDAATVQRNAAGSLRVSLSTSPFSTPKSGGKGG